MSNGFTRALIPTIRRVQPSLMASKILSVQPMSAPSGKIMALGERYRFDIHNLSCYKCGHTEHYIVKHVSTSYSYVECVECCEDGILVDVLWTDDDE